MDYNINYPVQKVRIEIMEFVKSSAWFSQGRCSLDQVPSFEILDLVLSLYKEEEKKRKRKKADSPG